MRPRTRVVKWGRPYRLTGPERFIFYLIIGVILFSFILAMLIKSETEIDLTDIRQIDKVPQEKWVVVTRPIGIGQIDVRKEFEKRFGKLPPESKVTEPIPPPEKPKRKSSWLFEIVQDFSEDKLKIYEEAFIEGAERSLFALLFFTGTQFKKTVLPLQIHLTDRTTPAVKYEKGVTVPYSKIEFTDAKGHIYLYIWERYKNEGLKLDLTEAETISGNRLLISLALHILLTQYMDVPEVIDVGIRQIWSGFIALGDKYQIRDLSDERLNRKELKTAVDAGYLFFYELNKQVPDGIGPSFLPQLFKELDSLILDRGFTEIPKCDVKELFDRVTGWDTRQVFNRVAERCISTGVPELISAGYELKVAMRRLLPNGKADISVGALYPIFMEDNFLKIFITICNNTLKPCVYTGNSIVVRIGKLEITEPIRSRTVIPPHGDETFSIGIFYKEAGIKPGDRIRIEAEIDPLDTIVEDNEKNNILTVETTVPQK